MTNETKLVTVQVQEDVAVITLNSPPLNILSARLMGEISDALETIAADPSLKAVAVQSAAKAFSAGADVGEHHPSKAPEMIGGFSRMFKLFGDLEIPVVMAVDGAALGAGFELCMVADVLIASDKASFGQPEIRLGFFAPLGVAYLPQLTGFSRAVEITAGGRSYSAQEMREFGFVGKVVPSAELAAALQAQLNDFRKASPLVLRLNMRMLKQLRGKPYEEARREAERVFLKDLMASEDVLEGIASFSEKRKPVWKNK